MLFIREHAVKGFVISEETNQLTALIMEDIHMLMVVSIKLREAIEKRGYGDKPYRALAKEMGISHVPLWKMLNNQPYNPSLEMLDKLCTFLKCSPGDILKYRKG